MTFTKIWTFKSLAYTSIILRFRPLTQQILLFIPNFNADVHTDYVTSNQACFINAAVFDCFCDSTTSPKIPRIYTKTGDKGWLSINLSFCNVFELLTMEKRSEYTFSMKILSLVCF